VKDGAKMSKSRGNVVVPDTYIQQWGADTFRMYLMFLGPFQEGGDFRDSGIVGQRRFLEKVWVLVHEAAAKGGKATAEAVQKLHRTIRKVSADTEALQYNTAIAAMMEYLNELKHGEVNRELIEPLVIMLAPMRLTSPRSSGLSLEARPLSSRPAGLPTTRAWPPPVTSRSPSR